MTAWTTHLRLSTRNCKPVSLPWNCFIGSVGVRCKVSSNILSCYRQVHHESHIAHCFLLPTQRRTLLNEANVINGLPSALNFHHRLSVQRLYRSYLLVLRLKWELPFAFPVSLLLSTALSLPCSISLSLTSTLALFRSDLLFFPLVGHLYDCHA